MGWRRKVTRRYTDPQIKSMLILQEHGVRFVSEWPFSLSTERGDGVIADIYLPQRFLRVECDDQLFHEKRRAVDEERDRRLLEIHGVQTVRLDNRLIMLASGEAYVMNSLKERGE
jgi:very-short-patch-repair endonuclease